MESASPIILQKKRLIFLEQLKIEEKWVIDAAFSNKQKIINDTYDLKYLIDFATGNGLAPILYKNTYETGLYLNLTKQFKSSYFNTLIQNTQKEVIISEIQKILSQANIPVIFLKGSILAFSLYPDSALRPMSDIDILVPEELASNAFSTLLDAGAMCSSTESDLQSETDHHLPPVTIQGVMIEVHRHLFLKNARYFIDNKVVWENKQQFKLKDENILGINATLNSLYICVHIYYTYLRGGIRLGWLYDFVVLSSYLKSIDPIELNSLIKAYGLERPVSFIGCLYYFLTNELLPNWPIEKKYIPGKNEIKHLVNGIKPNTQQKTTESYQLIVDQIHETPGLKAKYQIIKARISQNNQLTGKSLVKHVFLVGFRFMDYKLNRLLKIIRIK